MKRVLSDLDLIILAYLSYAIMLYISQTILEVGEEIERA